MSERRAATEKARFGFGRGALVMSVAALFYAAFSFQLASDGHAPSVTLLPISRQDYYAVQAWLAWPVLLVGWGIATSIAHRVGRSSSEDALARTADTMAWSLAMPLVGLFLLPDSVVYAGWGFAALGPLVRLAAPLAFAGSVGLATALLRRRLDLGLGRSFTAAFVAVLGQTAFGAVFLR